MEGIILVYNKFWNKEYQFEDKAVKIVYSFKRTSDIEAFHTAISLYLPSNLEEHNYKKIEAEMLKGEAIKLYKIDIFNRKVKVQMPDEIKKEIKMYNLYHSKSSQHRSKVDPAKSSN